MIITLIETLIHFDSEYEPFFSDLNPFKDSTTAREEIPLFHWLQNFEPGKPTNLTVTCQEDIGTITHVHLWTKARDERDSLYVDYITVAEPELKKT